MSLYHVGLNEEEIKEAKRTDKFVTKVVGRVYSHLKPSGKAYFLEPLSNVKWLERLRLLVPLKIDEEDKSHWEDK